MSAKSKAQEYLIAKYLADLDFAKGEPLKTILYTLIKKISKVNPFQI